MTTRRPFPSIKPSSRSYKPGTYPSTTFESLDGTKTHIRYGNKRVNATLQLGFFNISDEDASRIMKNYEDVNSSWDLVTFTRFDGLSGVSRTSVNNNPSLYSWMLEGSAENGGLGWRYAQPPTVTSTFKGRSNVSCSFVACLDAPVP